MGTLNPFAIGMQLITGGAVSSATITSTIFGGIGNNAELQIPQDPFKMLLENTKFLTSGANSSQTTTIKDVALQASTYGKVIPEVFGVMSLTGNIMWSSQIVQTTTKTQPTMTKSGPQGGGTSTTIRCSFAIAICKGVVDEIRSIYANGNPISLNAYNVAVYYGTQEQLPNSTMQSFLGTENVPAFRGLCYVVFYNFPLENFNGSIPNFTFTIVRNSYNSTNEKKVEDLIKAITIIPGTGEFVYDTITQRKFNGIWREGFFIETSQATILNNHTGSLVTNAVDSVNTLQKVLPNLEYISLVVCWFGNSLNAGSCKIYPACEFQNISTSPDLWSVNGISRAEANIVGRDAAGNMRYGGTPSDSSVVRYINEIRARGIKVCLYPMLMMDIENKPWRGNIYANDEAEVNAFFEEYDKFILHYAVLLQGKIDAIIIGSEMRDLTAFRTTSNTFPAVSKLCQLAGKVRGVAGGAVTITYAADWSEYHHTNGGWYNLDELWADSNIDVIGIDAYFPLTNAANSTYDIITIQNGWTSGEGYDFYYTNPERTQTAPLSPEWAWKNVEYFWKNVHYNPNGKQTAWIPKMKKIWFTEYGFPSVDGATNQPNVFYSPGSIDSGFPRLSQGVVDFRAQRAAILATELKWQNSEFVERKFLYTWDARPYPLFPNLSNLWSDGGSWKYGHFVSGKLGATTLSQFVKYLCLAAGLKEDEFDTTLLGEQIVDGYIIDKKSSIISHLNVLARTMFFDAYLDGGVLFFKSLFDTTLHTIDSSFIVIDENGKLQFGYQKYSEGYAPESVELLYNDIENAYLISTAIAQDAVRNNGISQSFSLPIPLTATDAQRIAWQILMSMAGESTSYTITLTSEQIGIAVLDIIKISIDGTEHLIRVRSIQINNDYSVTFKGVSVLPNENILTNFNVSTSTNIGNTQQNVTSYIPKTNLIILDLYNCLNNTRKDICDIFLAISSMDNNWTGASIFISEDNGQNYDFYSSINYQATVGKLLSISNLKSSANFVDLQTVIEIAVQNENNKLISITDAQFYAYKNIISIGMEVVAFRDVEQIDTNIFKLSHLLRGCFNTEQYISSHIIGENVILIDKDLFKLQIQTSNIGKQFLVKAVSNQDTLSNTQAISLTLNGNSIRSFEVKNIYNTIMPNGDLVINFDRRAGYKLYSNDLYATIGCNIVIYDATGIQKRTLQVIDNQASVIYTIEMQQVDFGRRATLQDVVMKVKEVLRL